MSMKEGSRHGDLTWFVGNLNNHDWGAFVCKKSAHFALFSFCGKNEVVIAWELKLQLCFLVFHGSTCA
jgi:hypothetical protein